MACNMFLNLPRAIKMPALGYGTWDATDDSLEKALEVALEAGYRHIDTAEAYNNEEVIGRVLKRWFDSRKLKREDIFITTKYMPAVPINVEAHLRESLRKLQLNYVDLYLIHFPIAVIGTMPDVHGDPNSDYLEIWKEMEEQYGAGRAKFIGVSNFSVKKIKRLLKNCTIKPANNQIEIHAYMQQKELIDLCNRHGITVVAYSPLGCRNYNNFLERIGFEQKEVRDIIDNETIKKIAKRHSKTPAQVALRFLLQLGVAPIPKSVTPARIRENINVFNFSLDDEDMAKIRALNIGPQARVCDFMVLGRVHEHPDFEF